MKDHVGGWGEMEQRRKSGLEKLWLLQRGIVRFRYIFLSAVVVLTAAFFYYCVLDLKLYDDPNKWPPPSHPYVQLNDQLQLQFGGANLVTVMISVKEGDIVNPQTLVKVKRITDKLTLIQGVIPYAIRSLSSVNTRYLRGTEDFLDNRPLFEEAARAPETPEELEYVRFGIRNNPGIDGVLVSPDLKSTVILADFRTGLEGVVAGVELPTTDPVSIYREITKIIEPENDQNHTVLCAGSPIIIGWVNSEGLYYVRFAFGAFLVVISLVLALAFRNVLGVLVPLTLGLIATIWGFGLQYIFYGDVLRSSSAFIAPFIIMAAAACHSVQFLRRFLDEEYRPARGKEEALHATFRSLFLPLVVSLLTDIMAFVVLMVVPFENVSVLGSVTAFGLASVVVLIALWLLPLAAAWPETLISRAHQRRVEQVGKSRLVQFINAAVWHLVYRPRVQGIVCAAVAVILVGSLLLFPRLEVGQDNTYAIHNFLTHSWHNSEIYRMEQKVREAFGGVYTLSFFAEGDKGGGAKTPEALLAMDRFGSYLQELPEVKGVLGLPFYIKIMHRFFNADKDEYFAIPTYERAQGSINEYLYFYSGGQPGSFDSVIDTPDYQKAMLVAYVTDTSHATVHKILERARTYLQDHFDGAKAGVDIRMAGGSVGIAGAFNESIARWLVLGTLLSSLASYIFAALMLQSLVGPALLLIPLFFSIVIWLALMYLLGIELNSNTTTGLAIATGVGIDAEVYLLYRFREEYKRLGNFKEALVEAFTKIRQPLIFSHLSLILGCWALIPLPLYVGYVGFSMGLILALTFLLSFFFAPVLWSTLQPAFLFRGLEEVPDAFAVVGVGKKGEM